MNYLDLLNFAIEESGMELDLLTEETWDSYVAGRRSYPRLKRYVNQSWKNIQLSRNQWEFKTAKVSDIVYPRFQISGGSWSSDPTGVTFVGTESGAEVRVRRVVTDPSNANGPLVGQLEFDLVKQGRTINPGELFVAAGFGLPEDIFQVEFLTDTGDVVNFPADPSLDIVAPMDRWVSAGTPIHVRVVFNANAPTTDYPVVLITHEGGVQYVSADIVVGENILDVIVPLGGDMQPGVDHGFQLNAQTGLFADVVSASILSVETRSAKWDSFKAEDWDILIDPSDIGVTAQFIDNELVIEGSISDLYNVQLTHRSGVRFDSVRITDVSVPDDVNYVTFYRVDTDDGSWNQLDFASVNRYSSPEGSTAGTYRNIVPIYLDTPVGIADYPDWNTINISINGDSSGDIRTMRLKLSTGEYVGADDVESFVFEQKGSYDFGVDHSGLLEIDWTSFMVSGENTAPMPVLYVPYKNWAHESHAYGGSTVNPPSLVAQDYAGNVVFLQQTLAPFRVSFIYAVQPQILTNPLDRPDRLQEAYHEWIAWEAVKRIATYDKNPQLYAHAERNAQFYRNRAEANLMPHMSWRGSRFSE